MKYLRLPCNFSNLTFDENEDKRLLKCKLKIQHDASNPNKSYFDLEDIKVAAEKTLRHTPILGSVVFDEDSEEYKLNGHDMEYKIIKGDNGFELKVSHIERIYGFIPHDAEIEYEYDGDNDRNYLISYGYLWKNYLDEVQDILDRNDGNTDISMEVSVDDSFEREDGLTQIKDYTFEGITMLGVPPGMIGANLEMFSRESISDIKKQMEELYEVYALEKEEDGLENENKNVNPEVQEFSLSVENITDQVVTQLNSRLCSRPDYWGDTYQAREFYFMDILPEDKIAIVENADYSCRQCYGVPYSISEDVITLDFDNKKSYICEWREMKGEESPQLFQLEDEQLKNHIVEKFNSVDTHENEVKELDELKVTYAELEGKLNDMTDYESLKEFKADYDKAKYEQEVEEAS
ncbi:MAG: hypothetical protein ACRDDY_10300, partial [Clostridium sp.]|uniref:hypothetical protein n=1 Tax=Clostridium sp. TaxID=1506 RepID=UPI003EE667B7